MRLQPHTVFAAVTHVHPCVRVVPGDYEPWEPPWRERPLEAYLDALHNLDGTAL